MRQKILIAAKTMDFDKLLMFFTVFYLLFPIGVFFLGWTKIYISLVLCAVLLVFGCKLHGQLCEKKITLIGKSTAGYWITIIALSAVWVYLSGIGGLTYQNGDFWARNPIFRDLSTYQWPVIYDLSNESEVVTAITGTDNVAFSYYFTWWLPVAWLSKLLHMGEILRNLFLYGWAVLGICLIIYCINRFLGKCSYTVPVVLISFGGLDIVAYYLKFQTVPFSAEIEWWADYFQYSANTTQLFFVFNQSIPIWLLVALLLQLKDNKYVAGVCSLAFAYSPWATIGFVPIALAGTVRKGEKFKNAVNVLNILVPALMLVIYGAFYMASSGSEGGFGLIFSKYPDEQRKILCNYLVLIFLEAGIYFWIMGKEISHYKYYVVTLLELLLFPLIYFRDKNLVMRGTLPALFLLMIFVIRFLQENRKKPEMKVRRYALFIALIIAAYTPLNAINRTLSNTMLNIGVLQEDVYSFGAMQTDNADRITTTKNQFFIYDYEDTVFFKYLAR
jgi:hypothetical protein